MTFINETKFILKKSDNNLVVFNIDDNIRYKVLDYNLDTLSSETLYKGKFSYINAWFDIDKNDFIYGIINDSKGKLISMNINNGIVNDSTLLKYDYRNFIIKFPYIKILDNEEHIIYFSINKKNKHLGQLIHIYKNNDIYIKNKIDLINYNILSNFIVTWKDNIPTIFYFNIVNGFEEIFMSTFNLNTLNWSKPSKLTNTRKSKIYLDVIYTEDGYYHIVYSENNDYKYYCRYLKLTIKDNIFKIIENKSLKNNIMCLFPTLISNKSNLFIQWVEYHDLYTCKSFDDGKSWGEPIKNTSISHYQMLRYYYKSNCNINNNYNLSYVFGKDNTYDVDKFLPK